MTEQQRVDMARYIPLLAGLKADLEAEKQANAKARKEVSCLQQEPSVRNKLKRKEKSQ